MIKIIVERPNTFDDIQPLTITLVDNTEMLKGNQLKNIFQYIFNNLKDSLNEALPINQNSESIIIDSNINTVLFFFANWRTHLVGKGIVKDVKFNDDPKIPGNSLEFTYINKYKIKIL